MSNPHTYAGPYLRIHEPVRSTEGDLCFGHNRRDGDTYCPQCGRTKRTYPRREGPLNHGFFDHEDWVDHLVPRLTFNEDRYRIVIALPNRGGFGVYCDRESDESVLAYPALGNFETAHALEIERIRSLGCEVEVKLGLVVYWS